MAYDPKFLGGPFYFAGHTDANWWLLDSIDLAATVIASGYIDDGDLKKIKKGDILILRRWDSLVTKATLNSVSTHYVTAVSAAGAVTLSAALNENVGLAVPVVSSTDTPDANDDTTDGYVIGTLWVETDADDVWIATDVTDGAAVWIPVNNRFTIEVTGLNFDNDTTLGAINMVVPEKSRLVRAYTVVNGTTTNQAGTVTLSRNATAITNGVITVDTSSAANTVDVCTPTAANLFDAGDRLAGALATTNTAAATLNFVALFERRM